MRLVKKTLLRHVDMSSLPGYFGFTYICRHYLDESLADHGLLADVAEEALVVPGQCLEGHKFGAA